MALSVGSGYNTENQRAEGIRERRLGHIYISSAIVRRMMNRSRSLFGKSPLGPLGDV